MAGSVKKHPQGLEGEIGHLDGGIGQWLTPPQRGHFALHYWGALLPAVEARDWRHCQGSLRLAQGPVAPL